MSVVQKSIRLFAWTSNYVVIRIVKGETSSRILDIELVGTTSPVDLTNCQVFIYGEKPDSTVVHDSCLITDDTRGRIQVVIPKQLAAVEGKVKCWIQVVSSSGTDLRFDGIILDVDSCNLDENMSSSSAFSALEEYLRLAETLVQELSGFSEAVDEAFEKTAQLNTVLSEASSTLEQLKAELERAQTGDLYVNKGGDTMEGELILQVPLGVSSGGLGVGTLAEMKNLLGVRETDTSVSDTGTNPVSGAAVASYVSQQLSELSNYDTEVF